MNSFSQVVLQWHHRNRHQSNHRHRRHQRAASPIPIWIVLWVDKAALPMAMRSYLIALWTLHLSLPWTAIITHRQPQRNHLPILLPPAVCRRCVTNFVAQQMQHHHHRCRQQQALRPIWSCPAVATFKAVQVVPAAGKHQVEKSP